MIGAKSFRLFVGLRLRLWPFVTKYLLVLNNSSAVSSLQIRTGAVPLHNHTKEIEYRSAPLIDDVCVDELILQKQQLLTE